MKKKGVLFIFCVLVSILIFSGNARVNAKEVRGVSDDTIKIAFITDLTGVTATFYRPVTDAFRNYFKYVNDEGGINGRKVKVLIEDDHYSIPSALACFKKLVFRDKVLAFFGPSGTGHSVALYPQVQKEKVPNLAMTIAEIAFKPFKRYVFVFGASYDDQFNLLFEYIMKDLKAKNPVIGIVRYDNEWGKVGLNLTKARTRHYNLKLREEVIPVTALDATTQVLSLKRAKVDYIIGQMGVGGLVLLLREAKKYRLDATIIGTYAGCSQDVVRGAGKAAKNYIGTQCFNSWHDDSPGIKNMKEITGRYDPGVKEKPRGYTMGWTAGIILTEGMKRAGKNLNNESLVNALETLKGFDPGDMCSPITFTSSNHKGADYCRIYKADVERGILVPDTGWRKPASIE